MLMPILIAASITRFRHVRGINDNYVKRAVGFYAGVGVL